MNAPGDWFALIDRYGGIIACLLGLMILVSRGYLRLGREYTRLEQENVELKGKLDVADTTMREASRAINLAIPTLVDAAGRKP